MSNSNLYYKAESKNVMNGGVRFRVMNGGCNIKSEEWRVYIYRRGMGGGGFPEFKQKILPTVYYFQQQARTDVSQGLKLCKTKLNIGHS